MARKSKLNNLHQTHGKVEKNITLDQVWGDTGTAKFGTTDPEKYDKYLDDLNKSDLQAHAVKVSLVPVDDRKALISRLKKEFKKHVSIYSHVQKEQSEAKLSKSAKDILSEGR